MNKSGFTLIMLVISIIVLVIICATVILKTNDITKDAKAIEFINNMRQIKSKVEIESIKAEDFEPENPGDTYIYRGELLTSSMNIGGIAYPLVGQEDHWYRFSDDKETYPSSGDLKDIGIEGIEGTYLINYITETVVSADGIKVDNIYYYTLEDISTVYDFGL